MSRLLESESDNDESGQSSYANSASDLKRVQSPKAANEQTIGSTDTTFLVQNKLEQFSRRLSMLGLASSQEEDKQPTQDEDEGHDMEGEDRNDSIDTTESGCIEGDGIAVPKQQIPMTTSLILNKLPKATDVALKKLHKEEEEQRLDRTKVQLKFQPIGSVPQITPSVCKISAAQPFSLILSFLLRKLKIEHVYCYINNSFAPNPQQTVGDLWSQFKVDDELIVGYCGSVAFG